MSNKWIGAVLSTDKDLNEERKAVIKLFKDNEIEVSAFEEDNFPINPDRHSHDICLDALQSIDFAVLIIKKRGGGSYYLDEKRKITRVEYEHVVQFKKPSIVLVEQKTWSESKFFHDQYIESKKSRDEFAETYTPRNEIDVDVLLLVDDIQHQYEANQYSNWIVPYSGQDDLIKKIQSKLGSLSRYFLQLVSEQQVKEIRKRRTSTPVAANLGEVFDRNYYIDPKYKFTDRSGTEDKLEKQIVDLLDQEESILITGEAGYGKTTILAKAFISYVEELKHNHGFKIALLLQLKDKKADYHFDIREYLEECFEAIDKEKYPFLDMTRIKFVFFLDGFDELSEDISSEELERISKTTIFQKPFLLTSRSQYAMRYLNNFHMFEHFNRIIEIQKWDFATAKSYIDNFLEKAGKDEAFVDNVRGFLTNNNDLKDILDSPLLTSMFLSIIENNGMKFPETIKTRVALFQESLLTMAKREHSKNPEWSELEIVRYWAYFSWFVYEDHLKRADEKSITNMIEYIDQKNLGFDKNGLITIVGTIYEIKGNRILGAFHEQFFEYLVAYALCDACKNENEPYPDFLVYVIRPEINRYFRGIWREKPEVDKNKIYKNLWKLYLGNIGKRANEEIAKRVHAIYHLTRLENTKREEYLETSNNIETHVSVKLSLYFGMIKLGNLEKEEEFYNLLEKDVQFNRANRGYHLIYYADMIPDGQKFPYLDDEKSDWRGTLGAFRQHFSKEKTHYFLRRIDLATMRHFIISRECVGPINDEIMRELRNYIDETCKSFSSAYPDYQRKINDEYQLLEEAIQKIRGKE